MVKRLLPDCETCPVRLKEKEHLTPREFQILSLIADGESNKEIGRQLEISEQTVKNHVSIMLAKFKVRDRTQLTVLAFKRGIIKLRRENEPSN